MQLCHPCCVGQETRTLAKGWFLAKPSGKRSKPQPLRQWKTSIIQNIQKRFLQTRHSPVPFQCIAHSGHLPFHIFHKVDGSHKVNQSQPRAAPEGHRLRYSKSSHWHLSMWLIHHFVATKLRLGMELSFSEPCVIECHSLASLVFELHEPRTSP